MRAWPIISTRTRSVRSVSARDSYVYSNRCVGRICLRVRYVRVACFSFCGGIAHVCGTMRAELIGHFQPCMTDIYLHIDARMADNYQLAQPGPVQPTRWDW